MSSAALQPRARLSRKSVARKNHRKGSVLILAAALMLVMMAFLAYAVDLGYVTNVKTELKRATDAAALAGAGELVHGGDVAQLEAFQFLARNRIAGRAISDDPNWQQNLAQLLAHYQNEGNFLVELGHWDPQQRVFQQSSVLPSAIRVVATERDLPLFFGKLFARYERVLTENGYELRRVPINVAAESIARYQPRDIALVLDFSASMNDDSEFCRIALAPADQKAAVKALVEANNLQIYNELQAMQPPPNCGNLPYEPAYPTVRGQPASGSIPHCTVTFGTQADGTKAVYVTSTMELSNVVIETHDGYRQKFEPLSGYSGTFKGTLSTTKNKRIVKVWVKSGTNSSGDGPGYGERFEWNTTTIKKAFGLDTVPYPYAAGSWDEFINYCNTSSNVSAAGYQYRYGWKNLINYWLERRPMASETADLWRVSAQPIQSLKSTTAVFFQYIQEVDTNDRVALVIYNSSNGTATLEHSLTEDFAAVAETVSRRQAGHYDRYTNIGAGIKKAREHLEANARPGAFKMIVLMTDGLPNRPYNDYRNNYAADKQYVIQQAQLVAQKNWPIVTISLGAEADAALMQQVADITGGIHFNVPPDSIVTDYTQPLLAVFRRIADHRPLVLVK